MNDSFRSIVAAAVGFIILSFTALADERSSQKRFDETQAITLFAFDNVSIPYTQNLRLEMRTPQRHPDNPVLTRGPDDSVDSWAVQFYGSVIHDLERDKYRMWYVAVSKEERADKSLPRSAPWRVAYAESTDGIHWTKPNLGLVKSLGRTHNNLVNLDRDIGVLNVKVLHEPDDPDPQRRYKMAAHVWFPKNDVRLGTLATFISPDGLSWTMLQNVDPVGAQMPEAKTVLPPLHFEPVGGLYKWDGLYHVSGQNAILASRPFHGRVSRTFISGDFANWSQANAIQFVRSPQHKLLGPGKSRMGEQTHEGISVWNRGNVLIGVSGMWHGSKEWNDVTLDLGFVISNDGVHFREPAHEHIFLKRGTDGEWDQGGLLQAQGFANVGEETRIYYGAWDPRAWQKSPPRGGVGIMTLPRDRFADLVVDTKTQGSGNYQMEQAVSSFLTSSIELNSGPHRFLLNADGLSKDAWLKIELLDHLLQPIPKYSGDDAAVVITGGFQSPVQWSRTQNLPEQSNRIRVRVTFEGPQKTNIRLSALYLR